MHVRLTPALEAGDIKQALGQLEAIQQFLQETESEVAPALDCHVILRSLNELKDSWVPAE